MTDDVRERRPSMTVTEHNISVIQLMTEIYKKVTYHQICTSLGIVSHVKTNQFSISFISDKRESLSLMAMDSRRPKGNTRALPASWEKIGYPMERKPPELSITERNAKWQVLLQVCIR
ncbi:hypothetical protein EVAR_74478_1 [Eumeta japonica]|uniref:Uncharacterized protein n=1 Tax=Eumeta variegata TaxID=151549 RepID=A0A4C1TBE4_EUMVA|nr:hypothetical protein EVAR_74478_1 [Eumeta japonica]